MILDPIISTFVYAIGGTDIFLTICTLPFVYAIAFVFYKICT